MDRVAVTPYTLERPLVQQYGRRSYHPSPSSDTMLQLRVDMKAVLVDYKSTLLTPQTFLLYEISIKLLQSCRQPNRQL